MGFTVCTLASSFITLESQKRWVLISIPRQTQGTKALGAKTALRALCHWRWGPGLEDSAPLCLWPRPWPRPTPRPHRCPAELGLAPAHPDPSPAGFSPGPHRAVPAVRAVAARGQPRRSGPTALGRARRSLSDSLPLPAATLPRAQRGPIGLPAPDPAPRLSEAGPRPQAAPRGVRRTQEMK